MRRVFALASILIMMAETAEDLSRRPEVRKELERTTGQKRGEKIETRVHDKFWSSDIRLFWSPSPLLIF